MTKEEILKQLKELQEQVLMLTEDDVKIIRTLPIDGKKYFYINTGNMVPYETNYPVAFDKYQTKENSSVGNYFKSFEDAEMVIRAMELEQAIRIRRIELNDGWEPDWGDADEVKYFISLEEIDCTKNDICVDNSYESECLPIFGYYQTYGITGQIIKEFEEELYWYFTEYYPNRDNMYVWGD